MNHQPKIFLSILIALIFFVIASKLSAQTIDAGHYPLSFGTASLIDMSSASIAGGANDSTSPSILLYLSKLFE